MNNNIKGVINRASKLNNFQNHKINVFSHLIKLNPNLTNTFETIIDHVKKNKDSATSCAHFLMGKTNDIPECLRAVSITPEENKILQKLLSTSNYFLSESSDKTIDKLEFIHKNLVSAQPEDAIKLSSNDWADKKQIAQTKIQKNIAAKMLVPESKREEVLKSLDEAIDASTVCVNRGLLPTKENIKSLGITISVAAQKILEENIKEFNILATHKNESSYFFNINTPTNRMKSLKEKCAAFYPTHIIDSSKNPKEYTLEIMNTKETSGLWNDCLCNSILGTGEPLKTNHASEIKKALGNPNTLKFVAKQTLDILKKASTMEQYFADEGAVVAHLLSTYAHKEFEKNYGKLLQVTDGNYDDFYKLISKKITRITELDPFVASCFIAMGTTPKINISINTAGGGETLGGQLFIDNGANETIYIQHRNDYNGLLSNNHYERLENEEHKLPINLNFSTNHSLIL